MQTLILAFERPELIALLREIIRIWRIRIVHRFLTPVRIVDLFVLFFRPVVGIDKCGYIEGFFLGEHRLVRGQALIRPTTRNRRVVVAVIAADPRRICLCVGHSDLKLSTGFISAAFTA